MNRPELYNKTVDILVQAYMNDTLQHNTCHACAVGNLVAANCGINIIKCPDEKLRWQNGVLPMWDEVHMVSIFGKHFSLSKYRDEARKQIDATGYSPYETAGIEVVFESNRKNGATDDERMFNSLLAVIDYLDEIHDNKDATITETAKQKFNAHRISRQPAAL